MKAAAFAFQRLKAFWKDKHVKEHVKLKVYKAVVQATLLYACETWAATSSTVKALDVFQMQCLRRVFGISKIQHVENVEILKRASMTLYMMWSGSGGCAGLVILAGCLTQGCQSGSYSAALNKRVAGAGQ